MPLKPRLLFPSKKVKKGCSPSTDATGGFPRRDTAKCKVVNGALKLDGFRDIHQIKSVRGHFADAPPNINMSQDNCLPNVKQLRDMPDSNAAYYGRQRATISRKAGVGVKSKVGCSMGNAKSKNSSEVSLNQNHIIDTLGAHTDAALSHLMEAVPQGTLKAAVDGYPDMESFNVSDTVPATAFLHFQRLPREVRIIIWTMALPELVEAFPDFHEKAIRRFMTDSPRESIFTICGGYKDLFFMSPIYLTNIYREKDKEIEPIYIRPEDDILYLNIEALRELDPNAFTARPENQVIQRLALPAIKVWDMRWCGEKLGRKVGSRSYVGDLVRGLKVSFPIISSPLRLSESAKEFFYCRISSSFMLLMVILRTSKVRLSTGPNPAILKSGTSHSKIARIQARRGTGADHPSYMLRLPSHGTPRMLLRSLKISRLRYVFANHGFPF